MKLRPLLTLFLGLFLLAPQALATWSIVVINRVTGEVGVASVTCIANFDLRSATPVVVVGYGAAAAQSAIDTSARNRREMRMMMEAGHAPNIILSQLAAADAQHQIRQYGIVSRFGKPVTFTGGNAGAHASGVIGRVGDFEYAIQGNVLAGSPVVLMAEQAFINTSGDLAEKMMAGMEAARAFGGDGRCSCSNSDPTGCGSPPANFTYSGYIGYFIVARPGDADGDCNTNVGCATGDYHININYIGNANLPDPVIAMQAEFDSLRAGMVGMPDHFASSVSLASDVLVADGTDTTTATVALVDYQGTPLTQGVASLEVVRASGTGVANIGTVTDLGNGTYTFDLTATQTLGQMSLAVTAVTQTGERIRITPNPTLETIIPGALTLGANTYSASAGTSVPMEIRRDATDAGALYRILASTSGISPGTLRGGLLVPLNQDGLYDYTESLLGGAPFLGSVGALDAQGVASATFALPADRLTEFIGTTLSFAAVIQTAQGDIATEARSLLIEL